MRRRRVRGLAIAVVFAMAAACGSDNTPTTPTTPTLTTDTFAGTLNQNGGVTHQFTTAASGKVTATITALGPDAAKAIGFSMGTQLGTVCQAVLDNPAAVQSSVLTATASTQGTFCVRVYDVGNVTGDTGPFSYTISVEHP